MALFFPLHLKSTKFVQNLSALHPFLGRPHLNTCLDQYIRLCPGPQLPSLPLSLLSYSGQREPLNT